LSAQIASALASVLLIIPMFCLGRELFSARVGFWGTVLFQCLPIGSRVLSDGLSEATFFLFLTSALWIAALALRTGSLPRFALCGVFGGLAYLTRPEGGLVLVAAGAVLLGLRVCGRLDWKWGRVLKCASVLTCAAVLVSAPYALVIGGFTNKP